MTYQQALQLCKQKRPAVDPIPAFHEQLKRYEQECRELGYLTATNAQNEKCNTKKEGTCSESSESTKNSSTIHTKTETVGSKRQVEASCDRAVKRRVGPSKPSMGPSIGPSIGPSRPIGIGPRIDQSISPSIGPSIGPSRPNIEPKRQSIGPSIGPSMGPLATKTSQKKAPIGPQRSPTEQEQVDK